MFGLMIAGEVWARALMEAVKRWAAERVRYVQWQAGRQTSAPFYGHLGYRGEAFP